MAIGKWIFSAATPAAAAAAASHTPVTVPVQPPVVSAADAKQFGLENFGNTCYANSVLQALYFCGPFRELLTQYPDPSVSDVFASPPPGAPSPQSTPASPVPVGRRRNERGYSISESSPSQASALSASPPNGSAGGRSNAPPPIPSSPPTLLSALRSLFLHISKHPSERGTVAPRAFVDKLRELNELFRGSMHQDAHEFLNFLLNKIVEEMENDRRNGMVPKVNGAGSLSGEDLSASIATLSSTAAGPASTVSTSTNAGLALQSTIVHRLFEGVLTSETRCLTCETVSARDESFLDLSIDIEQNSSVTACLRQFSASEMLCQKNKFFCDSCCDLQEAEKRMKIKKLPNILALHLKRFKYQEDVGKNIKLAYRVAFPMQLRLFNTADDAENADRLYELFAIVVHIGNGPHHGHYVTIIKARGSWLLFDDDSVETIKESDIPRYYGESTNGSAYVLYYQAVDLDMAALGLKLREPAPTSTTASTPTEGLTMGFVPSEVGADHGEFELGSPAVPPGLAVTESEMGTEDQSMSDVSEPPRSPSSTAPPQINMGASSGSRQVPSTSTRLQTSQGPLGNLFTSLRPMPSMRIKATNGVASSSTSGSTDSRKSWMDVGALPPPPTVTPLSPPPSRKRPTTAQSMASTVAEPEGQRANGAGHGHGPSSEPSSPHVLNSTAFPNGLAKDKDKERIPEKKTSMFNFKRKNSRLEASFSGTSSHPFREDLPTLRAQTVRDRDIQRPLSEAGSVSTTASALALASNAPADMLPSLSKTPPSAMSMPSTPINARPGPSYPEHKTSSPDLTAKGDRTYKRAKSLTASALSRLPKRPSTAGATVGSSSASSWARSPPPPLPPLPGSPQSPEVRGFSRQPDPTVPAPSAASMSVPRSPIKLQRPSTSSSAMGGGAGAIGLAVSSSTSSSMSTPDNPTKKRTSRKLSFTAPMLGLVRRDKQREGPPPPTSYIPGR